MSSGSYIQTNVGCPFYQYDEGRRLVCEGVFPDTKLSHLFRNSADCREQMRIFCCASFESCEVYRMLVENKYEED